MKKILYRLVLSIFVFCGVFSFALAQSNPATNWSGTPYVWGNPVINADGSVSAAMPNGWGSFGMNPFDNWGGTNVDNGQKWTINNRWLSDSGGRKIAELLGLNVVIYNTPGSCPFQELAAKRITNIICGSNSGRETPPGSWRYYSIDSSGENNSVVLEAYADYFLMGRDDVAKYLFENRFGERLACYSSYNQPFRNGMTFDQMKQNIESFNLSLCSTSSSGSGGSTNTGTGGTNTGSTGTGSGSGTTNSSVGSDTPVNLARKLVDSLFDDFDKSMGSISGIGLNLNTNTQTNTSNTNTTPSTNSACYVFNQDLKLGSTGIEVTNLTTRLVSEGFLSSQSSSFDQVVFGAVVAYQEKYASQILTPVGLTSGTGYFGKSTRNYMNSKCTGSTTNTVKPVVNTPANNTTPNTVTSVGTPRTPAPRLQEVDLSTLIFEKPLSSTIPRVSPSCPAWTSPTGLTPQDPEFYRGGVADKAPGEYEYRQSRPGMWYDRDYVDYNGGIATSPAPIFFGNIGFNPFSISTGVATSDNLSLKKGDTWILSDGGISLEGHKKVLSLLGVPPTPQKGEDDYIAQMRKYPAVSIFMNSYTLMYAKMFMQCEDDLARFMFINRNHPIFKTQFGAGYMYPRSGYDSPESFMSDAKANISYINREVSEQNRQADISDGISGVSTQTPQINTQGGSTLTSKQIQDIQSQITALLSQVSLLQEQLKQLK